MIDGIGSGGAKVIGGIGSGGAKVIASEPLNLRWDLAEAMTQSARLSQRISRAERDGDDRELLASAAELLRDFPLDELKSSLASHVCKVTFFLLKKNLVINLVFFIVTFEQIIKIFYKKLKK